MTLSTRDHIEIADLVTRYAAKVDARDFNGVCSLFTSEGVLVMPVPPDQMEPVIAVSGPDILRALGQLGDYSVTQHAVLGHVVDEGDEPGLAKGNVTCVANHLARRPDGRVRNLVWHLRYRDDYRRSDAGWQFTRRALHLDWIESRNVAAWRDPDLTVDRSTFDLTPKENLP